jgi:hypothetical protein
VTAQAGYEDFINRAWPFAIYTTTGFPGLSR